MQARNYMRFNSEFLRRYVELAPLALAIERSIECEILATQSFERPILDVGCGDGVFASVLCADPIETGVDFNPVEIARAKSTKRYCELLECGGDAVPKPDGTYRTIFSNSVLEHIADLMPVLAEQFRLLAEDGRFYVTVPTDQWERYTLPARLLRAIKFNSCAERYGSFYNAFWHHFHRYPASRWRALFEQAGFNVVEQKHYIPADITTLLDALTPLGSSAMISKQLLGRWIAVPQLRRMLAPILYRTIAAPISNFSRQTGGNLIFFALTK